MNDSFNSTLMSMHKSSDAHHDGFKDDEKIKKTLSIECQTKPINATTEDKMLTLIGLESKNRYINFLSDDAKTDSLYNIYTIGFEDKDAIVDEGVKTAINNIANPKLVVDFAYKSLKNIIDTRDSDKNNTEYIFNLPVDSDPASKIVPGSKTAKLLDLSQADDATIKFIDSRNGILEVPSANSIFNCSGPGVNDVEGNNLESIYQLFGSYYKLLLSKGKKKTFTVIVDEEKKIYTYSDKNFAAKESGIIDITINKFKGWFTTITAKGLIGASTSTASNPGLFDELSTYIKSIKKGEKNSPEHITAKGAGDALQMISALGYGQDGVAVSHDRLAVWLAYYIGVSTIIYMNRKDIEGQEKNRITIFQLKELSSDEQQIANMNKEIENISGDIIEKLQEYYTSIGITESPVMKYEIIRNLYDDILDKYETNIKNLIQKEYLDKSPKSTDTETIDTEIINTEYRILLSLCMLLLPHFKTLTSMLIQKGRFNYQDEDDGDEDKSVDETKIILENTRTAKKQLDAAMYCYMLNKTLLDSELNIDDYKTIVLVQDAAGRVSRRKPKQLLKPELFNQTRFDIILDALENSNVIRLSIKHFFEKLEKRVLETSKPIHTVSNQYIQSMKFFINSITSMTGGRSVSPVESQGNTLSSTRTLSDSNEYESRLTVPINNTKEVLIDSKPSPVVALPSTEISSIDDLTPSIEKTPSTEVIQPIEDTTIEPNQDTNVGIMTKIGSLYKPNDNFLVDDIFIKEVAQLVFTLLSFDKSVLELLDKKLNINPIIEDAFIEKLLIQLNTLTNTFDSFIGKIPEEDKSLSGSTESNQNGGKTIKQYGGNDEDPIIVNDVNESVFLFKLQDILEVVTNINKEKQIPVSEASTGAAASGAGASKPFGRRKRGREESETSDKYEYILNLNDVVAAIDNVIDDDQIPVISLEIANITASINSIVNKDAFEKTKHGYKYDYVESEIDGLRDLIVEFIENIADPRETRSITRNIYRLINAIGNDTLIAYYKYPVQPLLIDKNVDGIDYLEEKIDEIYGKSSKKPRQGGSRSVYKKKTKKNKNRKQKKNKRTIKCKQKIKSKTLHKQEKTKKVKKKTKGEKKTRRNIKVKNIK